MLALAVLLAGCIVVLILIHARPRWFTSLRAQQGRPAASGVATGSSGSGGTGSTATRAGGRRSTTTAGPGSATTATTSAGAPVITSISPASAAPGQKVAVSGKNFISANHVITGFFGAAAAGTSCPTLGECVLTVPAGIHGHVTVTLRTQNGVSNGEPFTVS